MAMVLSARSRFALVLVVSSLWIAGCASDAGREATSEPNDRTLVIETNATVYGAEVEIVYPVGQATFDGVATRHDDVLAVAHDHGGRITVGVIALDPIEGRLLDLVFTRVVSDAEVRIERQEFYDRQGRAFDDVIAITSWRPGATDRRTDPDAVALQLEQTSKQRTSEQRNLERGDE